MLIWTLWCCVLLIHKYKGYRFLQLRNRETILVALFVLLPLALIPPATMLLRRIRSVKSAWISTAAVGLVLLFLLEGCYWLAILQPITSGTGDLKNYLVTERGVTIPAEVKDVFPEQPLSTDQYQYYRRDAWRWTDNDRCFVLAHTADAREIEETERQLVGKTGLLPVEETWDGFSRRRWDGYRVLSWTRETRLSGAGYLWVLLPEHDGCIVYYYRPFATAEDHFLAAFLDALSSTSRTSF